MIHYHSLLGTWDLLIYWLQTNQYGRYGDGSIVTVPNLGTYTYIYGQATGDWWIDGLGFHDNFMNILTGWWFETCFIFPYIRNVIIPTDFHIFQRGRYTTNQLMLLVNSLWSTIKFPWIPIKLPDFHGGAIARRCCWNWNPNWLPKRRPSTTKTAGNFGDAQF